MAYKSANNLHFAPSRFIGYINNIKDKHEINSSKDGRVTNPVITFILGQYPYNNDNMERSYIDFCNMLGIKANGLYTRR